MTIDAAKVGVSNWPTPKFIKKMRGFLGLSGYYMRFIRNYGMMVRSLTNLLKKNTNWNWAKTEQIAFELLKQLVCQTPVLCLPNLNEEFCIDTDACG